MPNEPAWPMFLEEFEEFERFVQGTELVRVARADSREREGKEAGLPTR